MKPRRSNNPDRFWRLPIRAALLFATAFLCFLAPPPAGAGIVVEEHVLKDGRLLLRLGDRVFVPDSRQILRVPANGRLSLRSGGSLEIRAGRALDAPGVRPRFDPQPEPPGFELIGVLTDGRTAAILGSRLVLREKGREVAAPDGRYSFRAGAVASVRSGQLESLSDLAGFQVAPRAR
ncbi:MAG: hypothetical protein KJ058_03030 [Thermoanaerobaculia bacterium]|nr:hypothetical protein [Thermoanaerobaculia bacterium]